MLSSLTRRAILTRAAPPRYTPSGACIALMPGLLCACLFPGKSDAMFSAIPKGPTQRPQREFPLTKTAKLLIYQGDITTVQVDAIVNAANERMLGGGGVDGAIHRAAGPELHQACLEVPAVRPGVRCPTGEARITPGFNLPARYVIHTVGPVYFSAADSAPVLAESYRNSLKLANEKGAKSVAFPAISTGVYGYPFEEAAEVSLKAVKEAIGCVEEVHFVLFQNGLYDAYIEVAEEMFSGSGTFEAVAPGQQQHQAAKLDEKPSLQLHGTASSQFTETHSVQLQGAPSAQLGEAHSVQLQEKPSVPQPQEEPQPQGSNKVNGGGEL